VKADQRLRDLVHQLDRKAIVGKTAIIVGGTGGLGRALSLCLAAHGARVIVVGQMFRDSGTQNIDFVQAELSLLREARRIADLLPAESADLLVFTTGIFAAPQRQVTAEGIERDMAVSFLNRLVMLRAMAPRLGLGRVTGLSKPRVFVMGFPGAGSAGNPVDLNSEQNYSAISAHSNTVAGNEALVLDAARRYPQLDLFGLNPGLIKTAIRSNFLGEGSLRHRLIEGIFGLIRPSPEQYAQRTVPLLISPQITGLRGAMFNSKGKAILPSAAFTDAYVAEYIAASEDLAKRAGDVLADDGLALTLAGKLTPPPTTASRPRSA
jgi:NAD(P)-dependent dehydrogenase (short-subunit alcohol dehydrogenase family)